MLSSSRYRDTAVSTPIQPVFHTIKLTKRQFTVVMSCTTVFGLFFFCTFSVGYGQLLPADKKTGTTNKVNGRLTPGDTTNYFTGICKQVTGYKLLMAPPVQPVPGNPANSPFIKVRGNIQYDFIYRSLVDTPFAQKDFTQHSMQTTMDVLIRNQYPFRVNLLSRRSNSPYFSDITDASVQFNRTMFLDQIKNDLRRKTGEMMKDGQDQIQELERAYRLQQQELLQVRSWLQHPSRLYEIAAAKEKLAQQLINKDSLLSVPNLPTAGALPSIPGKSKLLELKDSSLAAYEQKKKLLDSLELSLKKHEDKLRSAKKALQDSVNTFKQEIAAIHDPASLKKFVQKTKMRPEGLPKGWRVLGDVTNVGLGRTWIDYSELTVKNISLTGVNVEANPGRIYLAAAAGKINARFRDFVIKDNHLPTQSLLVLRAGIGKKDRNNLVITWFNGKRAVFHSNSLPASSMATEKIMGISVESRFVIDERHVVVLETARSSFYPAGNQPRQRELLNKIWDLKDGSNQAYSIKVNSDWPATATNISGYYRKMGEHFQSFNLQPMNVHQEAYQVKVQQGFWRKKLMLEAGIRKNDFSNPYSQSGVNSKTVFKSFLGTLRIPKYPTVSVGFYPSSQLTVLDNEVIVENQYNTLTAMISHAYRLNEVSMSTNGIHIRFYNQGADTGFIYYNASSWTLNHYIFWNKLQSQSGCTITGQQDLKVISLEQSFSYQLREWLNVSAGAKYNRVNKTNTLWGGLAGMTVVIPKTGTIQLQYDRSFLPGVARNLLPVDMGRVSFHRNF